MDDCIFTLEKRMSVRVENVLEREGITTLTELAALTGPFLMTFENFGHTSLLNVRGVLAYYHMLLAGEGEEPSVQEIGTRQTVLGPVQHIHICTHDYRRLSWDEVWETFTNRYPGKWAVQFFPPTAQMVDQTNIYHLYVLEDEPLGFNVHPSKW